MSQDVLPCPKALVPWRLQSRLREPVGDLHLCALLSQAIRHNCLHAIKLILGCLEAAPRRVLSNLSETTAPSVVATLIDHGLLREQDAEGLLVRAVKAKNSAWTKVLLVSFPPLLTDSLLTTVSGSAGSQSILRVLLSLGADPNAGDGKALCAACEQGDVGAVRALILHGADVDCGAGQPVRAALRRGNASLLSLLLFNGASDAALTDTYPLRDFSRSALARTRVNRLATAIRASHRRIDFRWQFLAVPGKLTFTGWKQLLHQAGCLQIETAGRSKREICAALAAVCYGAGGSEPLTAPDDYACVDLVGDPISALPKWQRYECCGRIFNIFDLFKLVQAGKTVDPYRFQPLPLQDLSDRRRWLQKTLIPHRFRQMDLFKDVADKPLPSPVTQLREMLLREVWEKIPYPPGVELVLDADDLRLDDIAHSLSVVITGSRPYAGMDLSVIWKLRGLRGFAKKKVLAETLSAILAPNDEWSSSRAEMIGIVLRHCDKRAGDADDLFDFMLQEEGLSEDFEWHPF